MAEPKSREPWTVARDPRLDRAAKLRRLRELEFDARQALVASEEGMGGPAPDLAEVLAAIAQVEPRATATLTPTKY